MNRTPWKEDISHISFYKIDIKQKKHTLKISDIKIQNEIYCELSYAFH